MKRKSDSSAVETESSQETKIQQGQSILRIGLPYLILSLLVIVLVAIFQYFVVVSGPSAQKNQIFVNTALRSYVDSILVKLENSQEYLSQYAKNRQLVTAVVNKDAKVLKEFEEQISSQIPYSIGVKVLFPENLREDPNANPPISFAVVDLAGNVAKNQKVEPEVIAAGKSGQYLAMFAPIKSGDQVIGVLLLGISNDLINQTVERVHSVPGYVEVWQVFFQQSQTVATQGNSAFKQGEPFALGKSQSSRWQVAFWPENRSEFSGQMELIYFAVGLLIILSGSAVVNFVGLKTLQHQVKVDIGELAKLMLDPGNTKGDLSQKFKIDYFRDLILTINRSGARISAAPASSSSSSSSSSLKEPEPVSNTKQPLIASLKDDDGLEVNDSSNVTVSESIFRAYDIRGIVDTQLTPEVVREIGRAIGSEAFDRGEQKVVVARDGRLSGPSLMEALIEGIKGSGRDVIDIGEVPTPILYFATNYLDSRSGVMLTGSHNPANYNGLKIVIAGETLSQKGIRDLYLRIKNDNFVSGKGSVEKRSLIADYMGQVTGDVALAQPLKVAVDCGNGVAGAVVPRLLQALGCEVIGLYCNVDGNFPNHHPDPSKPENLKDLINMVKNEKADIGLAFDGDGDRLGVIASDGSIIWPDRQMMLYAIDVLSRNPGADILFDVKCTRHLPKVISSHGGRPIMWKTGHSLMKAKMKETGALLAGECSGHVFFKERWYGFDDALYTAARLLEILAGDVRPSAEVFAALPNSEATPEINISISDTRKFDFVNKLSSNGKFGNGKITSIDGIRVDFDDGWGLVRASNTTPALVIRFEADNQTALHRIQDLFRQQIQAVDSSLQIPF